MIKRITTYIFTASLSLLPLIFFLIISTNFGLGLASKIGSTFFDIYTTSIHGSLISGRITAEKITTPLFTAESVKIKISTQPVFPFLVIDELSLKKLTIKPSFGFQNESKLPFIPISLIKIDQLNIEHPIGTISGFSQITSTFSPKKIAITGQWKGLPLTIESTTTETLSTLTHIGFNDQKLEFVSKNSTDTLHIQSPPEQDGHFVLFFDRKNNSFSADIDYELNLSDDLSINIKLAAYWENETGAIHINKLSVNDQNKTALISADYEFSPEKHLASSHIKLQDNEMNLSGICLDDCDINLQYHFENMEQISSNFAGDAAGSLHIYGPWGNPSYYFLHQSQHFRSKFLSADHLVINSNNNLTEHLTKIEGTHIGIQNNLIPVPWTINFQTHLNHLKGNLILNRQTLPFTGELGPSGSIRLFSKNIQAPWKLSKDLLMSMDQRSLSLNIHPICIGYFDNRLCLAAHLSPTLSYLDITDISTSGNATFSLHDLTSYFHIDEYHLSGSLFFSSSNTLKLHSDLHFEGGKGFIANIIPNFFIPINYEFEKMHIKSAKNGNLINAMIKSNQGDLNASLRMNDDFSGIVFELDLPSFHFQEKKHSLNGSHHLSCHLNADYGNCHAKLSLDNSQIEFTQLTPTTELPDDILIDTPVNMKKSSNYPLDLKWEIDLTQNNSISLAGLSGPLTGKLNIHDKHGQPSQTTGEIKINPATFTLFGKHIPISTCKITYFQSPLYSPMINIATSKNIRSTHNQSSEINFSIFGRSPDLNINLKSSSNSMTQLEIISALFSGPRDNSWNPENDKVVLSILTNLLSDSHFLNLLKSLSNLEKGLNIDSLSISPQFSLSNDLSDTIMSTKITLKKNLTTDSFLQYQFLLNENKSGMLSFIYQLPSDLLLELYLQINSSSHGVNLLYQQ